MPVRGSLQGAMSRVAALRLILIGPFPGVRQAVKSPDFHSGYQGFKSPTPDHMKPNGLKDFGSSCPCCRYNGGKASASRGKAHEEDKELINEGLECLEEELAEVLDTELLQGPECSICFPVKDSL